MVAGVWRRCALLVFLSHTSALPLTVDAAARVLGVSPPLSRALSSCPIESLGDSQMALRF